ncbi:MAG TPA: hypothetical protein VF902_03885 [Coriobacteriia bacterium]
MSRRRISDDADRHAPLPVRTAVALGVAALLLALGAGCGGPLADESASIEREALLRLQTPASTWWTGNGGYAVVQAVGADGRPVVAVWDRSTSKVRTYAHYRVVGVEPHAPRFWVVPDSRIVPWSLHDSGEAHVTDIAGDGIDSRPDELYAVRLDEDAKPRSDVDARWAGWSGSAQYAASVEIDINKGACPSTLRFYSAGSSLNAWSAKVPTDVVTFEPIGWSPSGLYFAVITQADASATADAVAAYVAATKKALADSVATPEAQEGEPTDIALPPQPTRGADIVVFFAKDGAVAARQPVTVPVLEPNVGSNLAAWSVTSDLLSYFGQAGGRAAFGAVASLVETRPTDPFAWVSSAPPSSAWFAGSDPDGLLVGRVEGSDTTGWETRVWKVGDGRPAATVGPVPGNLTARWSPAGGMLSLAGLQQAKAWTVYLSRTAGGTPAQILTVEPPSGPLQPK